MTAAAGDVDAAISIASFRAGRSDWTRPDFPTAEAATELTDLRHPLVHAAVPNSIAIQPGRGVVITGSNMSGKSTFLRTVGVNVVLAQTIHTCLARQYRAPVLQVRSCIGRADDLSPARATTSLKSKHFWRSSVPATTPCRTCSYSTNCFAARTRSSASPQARRCWSSCCRRGVALRSPMSSWLRRMMGNWSTWCQRRFDAYHFGDSVGPDGLTFDHRLQQGPATTRNAIALLRLHGAPETLLAHAVTTAEMLDRQRGRTLVAR